MLETIRAWLNGKREYFTGVAIYANIGDNGQLLEVFKKGPTPFTSKRLFSELLEICNQLKEEHDDTTAVPPNEKRPAGTLRISEKRDRSKVNVHSHNEALYETCLQKAHQAYKQVMNDRAVLFASVKDGQDPNAPEQVKERAPLAIAVVTGFQKASDLYDQADHVKVHGHLPGSDIAEKESEYDALPDIMVKQALDNLRKNYNKMKKREVTPEREALLQQHEINIEKLKARWDSLT